MKRSENERSEIITTTWTDLKGNCTVLSTTELDTANSELLESLVPGAVETKWLLSYMMYSDYLKSVSETKKVIWSGLSTETLSKSYSFTSLLSPSFHIYSLLEILERRFQSLKLKLIQMDELEPVTTSQEQLRAVSLVRTATSELEEISKILRSALDVYTFQTKE